MELDNFERCVFQANTKLNEMGEFVCKNANNLQAHEMEKQIFFKVLEIGKELLEGYFAKVENNDVGQSIVDKDGIVYKRHSNVGKDYFSIMGKIKMQRMSYWKKGENTIYPLDIQCNIPECCYSYFLQEIMDSMSVNSSFSECEQDIKTLFNLTIHDKQFEEVTRDTITEYESFYQQNSVPAVEVEGEFQVLSFDGKGVPMIKKEAAKIKPRLGKGEKKQKKKEALVGISYTVDKHERTAAEVAQNLVFEPLNQEKKQEKKQKQDKKKVIPKGQNIRRIASIKQEKKKIIEQVQADAIKRNQDNKRPYIVLIDGSLYLMKMIIAVLQIPNYVLILDIIHVLEYLYLAAHSLHKENTHESRCYVYELLKAIMEGKVEAVIKKLEEEVKNKELCKSKSDAISKVIKYLENHKQMMYYDQYLAKGYPIGTGVVESACRLLVKDRMEGSGMRWSLDGAEAMLLLRSLKYSSHSKEYYKFHTEQENIRLYENKKYTVNQQLKNAA